MITYSANPIHGNSIEFLADAALQTIVPWPWLPVVISLIALAQPWFISLVRQLKPTTIEALESGKGQIFVSLSEGSFLALIGVFKVSKSLIIARTEVELKKENGMSLLFEAFSFRLRNDNGTERNAYPVAVSIEPDELELYNILFSNSTASDSVRDLFARLNKTWMAAIERHLNDFQIPTRVIDARGQALRPITPEERQVEIANFFTKTFVNGADYQALLQELQTQVFWTAGKYLITFRQYALSKKKDVKHETKWEMHLSSGKCTALRARLPVLIQAACLGQNVSISETFDYARKLD